MRPQRQRQLLAFSCLLFLLAGAAPGQNALLSGDSEAIWLVRSQHDGTFDIATRPVGGKWQRVNKDLSGQVRAAVAADDELQVLFSTGDCRVFRLDAPDGIPGLKLDAAPLAACSVSGLAGMTSPAVLVAVDGSTWHGDRELDGRPAISSAPAPATTAAAAQARPSKASAPTGETARASAPSGLVIFQSGGDKWQFLARLGDVAVLPDSRVFLASTREELFVLTSRQGDHRLVSLKTGVPLPSQPAPAQPRPQPVEVAMPPLPSAKVLAMQAYDERLAIIFAVPSSDPAARELRIVLLAGGQTAVNVVARQAAQPMTWPADQLPLAARFGDSLALVWSQGQAMKMATCRLSGEIVYQEDLDILQTQFDLDAGTRILQYFFLGVSLLFLPVFLFRPRTPMAPFALPPSTPPAPLFRRFLAAAVDLAPFLLATSYYMTFQGQPPALSLDAIEHPSPPIAYATAIALSLYLVYCVAMESAFGATVGKMVLKLKVVGNGGSKPSLRDIALRNILKIMELYFLALLVPIVIVLLSRNRQRLGDLLARTAVIDLGASAAAAPRPPDERPQNHGHSDDDESDPRP